MTVRTKAFSLHNENRIKESSLRHWVHSHRHRVAGVALPFHFFGLTYLLPRSWNTLTVTLRLDELPPLSVQVIVIV